MTGTRFEQAALDLAEAGYHVFPCHERGKEPRVGGGFKAATRDERQILSWWDRWPTANIGVACGATGIAVLDIDSKAGADPDDVLGDLDIAGAPVVRSGEAPEPSARYPRSLAGVRGAQVFFKGALRTTNKIGIPGAEIRAVGALVVVPPSVHPSASSTSGPCRRSRSCRPSRTGSGRWFSATSTSAPSRSVTPSRRASSTPRS